MRLYTELSEEQVREILSAPVAERNKDLFAAVVSKLDEFTDEHEIYSNDECYVELFSILSNDPEFLSILAKPGNENALAEVINFIEETPGFASNKELLAVTAAGMQRANVSEGKESAYDTLNSASSKVFRNAIKSADIKAFQFIVGIPDFLNNLSRSASRFDQSIEFGLRAVREKLLSVRDDEKELAKVTEFLEAVFSNKEVGFRVRANSNINNFVKTIAGIKEAYESTLPDFPEDLSQSPRR